MTQEEINERNIALATYMGWEVTYSKSNGELIACNREDSRYMHWDFNPPFHNDMNLLMPVVARLLKEGFTVIDLSGVVVHTDDPDDECYQCMIDGDDASVVTRAMCATPALALWEAVSSLVMELQKQQKAV